jgi:uncharacterized protein (DUF885 family)
MRALKGRPMLRIVALVLASFAALAPASASYPGGDAFFTALAHGYFYEGFKERPVDATAAGVHDYDDRLGSFGEKDYAQHVQSDLNYLAKLTSIDTATLSPDVALDLQLLLNAVRADLTIDWKMQRWRHDPDRYVNIASGGVFGVASRQYAPAPKRLAYAVARELAIPKLFAQAEADLTSVDAISAKLAHDDALGAADFFAQDVPLAFAGVGDAALRARFKHSTQTAVAAARAYAAWLERGPMKHPKGTFAIGAANYSLRLKYEEALDIPLERYLAIGERALADTRAQFLATARRIDPKKSPEAIVASLQLKHPSAAGLRGAAAHELIALRRFIVSHHILTLPADADIKVEDTPAFERQTSFASMDAPGPLEKVATKAFFNVTPVDPKWSAVQQAQFLGFLNDYALPIIAAHEVYPGHYVNYAIDKRLKLSLTRKLLGSSSFAEGWAHYDEQMMVDAGFGGADPRVRLAQLSLALLRECRFVVGVREHAQGMTVGQATEFFMKNGFMGREPASHEALRGTQDATYGYYTLGKLEILKLRHDLRAKWGAGYSLQRFHDALLAHGDPPIPLLRPMLLGSSDDGVIL